MATLETFKLFVAPLENHGIEYFVTGSTASMVYGEPRLTLDIDLVVHLSEDDVSRFETIFRDDEYYCPPQDVIEIENKRDVQGHFNLIHPKSGLKADIYPASRDPLYAWAFKNRRRINIGGTDIWIAPPEYIIIRKFEYFREGGSEKHIRDIEKMLPHVQANLDQAFLNAELKSRGLDSFWIKIKLSKEV